MAKILEEKPWAWIFECRTCHTKIEAGIDDIDNYRVTIPPKAKEGAATRLAAQQEAHRQAQAAEPKSEDYRRLTKTALEPLADSKAKES
jgi:hypothetical protein